MIRIACPGCAAVISADESKADKTGQCPRCGARFVVPRVPTGEELPPEPVEISPCPGCEVRLSVAPADLERDVECPYCATVFQAIAARPGPPSPHPETDEPRDRPPRRVRRSRRDEDYEPRPTRYRKPGEVTAIGVMLLCGGITALLMGLGVGVSTCCLWPVSYLSLVWGILAIIRGSQMIGPRDDLQGPPRVLMAFQIVLILNLDIVNFVLGIVGLVLLSNPEVREYYLRHRD